MNATLKSLIALTALAVGSVNTASAQYSMISGSNAYTDSSSSSGSGFSTWTPTLSPGNTTSSYNPGAFSMISGNTWDPNVGTYNPTVPSTYWNSSGYGTTDYMGNTLYQGNSGGIYNLQAGYDYVQDGSGSTYQIDRGAYFDPNTFTQLNALDYY